MLREFVVTYFKRVLMIFPIVAVVTLIPSYPLDAKVVSILAFFVILLIPLLVELAPTKMRAQQEIDAASVDDISDPTSRKARRIESRSAMVVDSRYCRVCGYDPGDPPPWGEYGRFASFDICPCCNVEWGYEDSTFESTAKYRARWINNGAKWASRNQTPDDLSVEERLERSRLRK